VGDELSGRTVVPGVGRGRALVFDEPLSFWGGIDPATGTVIDVRHPQAGQVVTGRVLVMPSGRGSSSSSSVLAEAVRAGTAPAAIVLLVPDPVLALGAIVAGELYGRSLPVVVLQAAAYASIRAEERLTVRAGAARARIIRPAR
jgi:predicted aconitase with swiveling domain